MTQHPLLQEINEKKRAIAVISEVLAKRQLPLNLTHSLLHLHPRFIVEYSSTGRALSNTILDHMFPFCPSPATLYHYTSPEVLRSIATTGEWRLYSLSRRVDQQELSRFAKTHHLEGYLSTDKGEAYFRELARDLFYSSFKRGLGVNENDMWLSFASGGRGVRMQLEVTQGPFSELRFMQYEQKAQTLLNELNSALDAAGFADFVPRGLSKIGAFFLPTDMAGEDEIRLLTKRVDGPLPTKTDDAQREFLPIALNQETGFGRINISAIEAGPTADIKGLEAMVANTLLEPVPLTKA